MIAHGVKVTGAERNRAMAAHLESAFVEADEDLYGGDVEENIVRIWNENTNNNNQWRNVDTYTEGEIRNTIKNLCPKKDPGPMSITPSLVKSHVEKIAPPLASIFNASVKTNYFPPDWKNSFIAPIPKKGSKEEISNYRGIAMQSVFPKIFDRVTTEKLYTNIDPQISKF